MSKIKLSTLLLGMCVLLLSSCAGNINGKGYPVTEVVSSEGAVYQIFEASPNHKGLADANGDILIKPKYSKIEYVDRADAEDCCIVSYRGEVTYSDEEREQSGYYNMDKRIIPMTGVYTISGKKILPEEFTAVEVYPNNVFVAKSKPSISGATTQSIFKGKKRVWIGEDIYVSKAGTCALGDSGNSFFIFINPDTGVTFPLGKSYQYGVGDNCVYCRINNGHSGEVWNKDGEKIISEGRFDRVVLADGDYIICEIGNLECVYHVSNMKSACLMSEFRRFSPLKGAPGLFIVGELMPNAPYNGWDYYQYGIISASGDIVLPIIHDDIRVKDDKVILDHFYPTKDEVISIEDLITKSKK